MTNADVTPEILAAMRAWIEDCTWTDLDDASELTDAEVLRGVQRNYVGDVAAFIRDGN